MAHPGARELARAASLEPAWSAAQYSLGVVYDASGRYEEAVEAFGAALRADPRNVKARFERGLTHLFGLNNETAARFEYEALKAVDPEKAEELFRLIYE